MGAGTCLEMHFLWSLKCHLNSPHHWQHMSCRATQAPDTSQLIPAHSSSSGLCSFLGNSCLYFIHCLTDWVCKSTEPTHAMGIQLLYPTALLRGGKTVFSVCFGLGLVLGKFARFVFFLTLLHWKSRLHLQKRNREKWQKEESPLTQRPNRNSQEHCLAQLNLNQTPDFITIPQVTGKELLLSSHIISLTTQCLSWVIIL